MQPAPPPADERDRIHTLRSLGILDSDPEERFDRLTRLARRVFDVPIALVSLVDADRQWFKSRAGLDADHTPREQSFCAHAILGEEALVVNDATRDARFEGNPLVTSAPDIRFYAGVPVHAPDGQPLGTICVIDREPRAFEEDDEAALRDLAALVEQELHANVLATTDALTGLTNRRGFDTIATHALALARRVDQPSTLLLFDLDGFKEINDTLGHAAGDAVLEAFAGCLATTFRDSDVVARLGGDEFCVLLSGATEQDAQRPLANLEACLASAGDGPRAHFSVGVETYDPEVHDGLAALLEVADAHMYEAKGAQRR